MSKHSFSFDLKKFFKHLFDPFITASFQENLRVPAHLFSHAFVNSQNFWPCCPFIIGTPFWGPTADWALFPFLSPASYGSQCCLEILPSSFQFFHFYQIFKHNGLVVRPNRCTLFFTEKIGFIMGKPSIYYQQVYQNSSLPAFLLLQ